MKKNISIALIAATALFALTASAQATAMPNPQTPMPMVGGDRDAHGCIPSAGYTWNEARQECLRPFENKATVTTDHIVNPVSGTPMGAPGIKAGIRAGIGEERKALVASTTEQRKEIRTEIKDNRQDLKANLGAVRASTTAVIRDMRGDLRNALASTTPAQRKDLRDQFEEQARALRASSTAARAEIKDEALKARLEIAHKQTDLINVRLDAAITRVQTLADRTSTALDNLATKGVTVDASRAKIVDSKAKLDEARAKASAVKLAIEAAFASATPKIELDKVQPLIKDTTDTIQAAQKLVAEAISLVKPGLNKPRATSTPATNQQ